MTYAKEFEKIIIRMLCEPHLDKTLIDEICEMEFNDYDYSGCGYFLFFKHPDLPKRRIVCSKPNLLGDWNNIQSGFIIFIEDHEIMFECYTNGETEVPENYRQNSIQVSKLDI